MLHISELTRQRKEETGLTGWQQAEKTFLTDSKSWREKEIRIKTPGGRSRRAQAESSINRWAKVLKSGEKLYNSENNTGEMLAHKGLEVQLAEDVC